MKDTALFLKDHDNILNIENRLYVIYIYFPIYNMYGYVYVYDVNALYIWHFKIKLVGFPGGAEVKNPPANAGNMGSSPGPGRSHMPWSN